MHGGVTCSFLCCQEHVAFSEDEVYDVTGDETDHIAIGVYHDVDSEELPGASVGSDHDISEGEYAKNEFALALKPFAVLLLLIKNTYSLSDSCIRVLLLLLTMLIKIVGLSFRVSSSDMQPFLDIFPTTEHQLRTLANCTNDGFAVVSA